MLLRLLLMKVYNIGKRSYDLSTMSVYLISTILVITHVILVVNGHGRLLDPPSRSSMWRMGFTNPPNYNDNQLFCGGFFVQWEQNGGKCGVCGDSYTDEPKDNEPGGKYANGIIVKKYDMGQMIEITVHLTANHKGWFEYRLCQNDDVNKRVQQDCFDKHLLADESGVTRFTILPDMRQITHKVRLPAGVSCADCVLQWKYNTGNSWKEDPVTGEGCLGCGPQEQFYACADVAINRPDVNVGEKKDDVEVPKGDVDERKEMDSKIEYNPDGTCMPCTCGQTKTNSPSGSISLSSTISIYIITFLAIWLTSFCYM